MDGLEEKLNSVLSDPQMMQKIMTMAQALGSQSPQQPPDPPPAAPSVSAPDIDLRMLQKLSGAASQAAPDRDQQALLKALVPYLSRDRIGRLERAMRAAKMAKLASAFLGTGGFQSQSGR